MKKWIKYLAVPVMALALAFVFSFKAEPTKAYIVNDSCGIDVPCGDSTKKFTATLNDVTDDEIDYFSKMGIGINELGKTYSLSDIYSEITIYKRKGSIIDGSKYLILTNQFISSEEELKEAIKNYINEKETIFTYTASLYQTKREGAILDNFIEVYEKILSNNTSCAENYFYTDCAKRCVYTDDIAVPTRYIITDYAVRELQTWSQTQSWTNTGIVGSILSKKHKTEVRDTILFNLPVDVECVTESINSITVTYSTCSNKTDGKCDEASDKKTVTYYDNGTISITRYDSRKYIDTIPNMSVTSTLAEVEAAHPKALDSTDKYQRLFKKVTASNVADTYKHYLVLNVDDTMYIEMIEVDITLVNGKTSTGYTEGSVVKDESTEVTTLALVTKCLMYLGYALLAIGLIVVAKSILKPVGDVISDSSAVRKEKSIAKAKNSYKKGNRKR